MRVGVPERALACARPHIAACSVAEIMPRLVDERRASAFNRSLSVFASFSSCEIILWLAFVIGSFSVTPAILPFARLRASATMKREFAFRHSLSLPSLLTCSCQRITLSVSFFTVGNMSVRAPNVACFLSPMVASRSCSGTQRRRQRHSAPRSGTLQRTLAPAPAAGSAAGRPHSAGVAGDAFVLSSLAVAGSAWGEAQLCAELERSV